MISSWCSLCSFPRALVYNCSKRKRAEVSSINRVFSSGPPAPLSLRGCCFPEWSTRRHGNVLCPVIARTGTATQHLLRTRVYCRREKG
eukprot:m.359787 g.359787  ORF g.359787 m.359787 type:complete len:88 (+) comp28044_c0_seq24:448-711(+)